MAALITFKVTSFATNFLRQRAESGGVLTSSKPPDLSRQQCIRKSLSVSEVQFSKVICLFTRCAALGPSYVIFDQMKMLSKSERFLIDKNCNNPGDRWEDLAVLRDGKLC